MNEKLKDELINNKACELSLDETYFEKLYVSFVLNYAKELNDFIIDNKKVLDGWFKNNNNNRKRDLFVDMLTFVKTVKLKGDFKNSKEKRISSFEIDYALLSKYVSLKDQDEISLIWDTAKVVEKELNNSAEYEHLYSVESNEKYNYFFELFKQHQVLLNFILDEEFRKKAIYDNLVDLSNVKTKVSEEFAIQKSKVDQSKLTLINH